MRALGLSFDFSFVYRQSSFIKVKEVLLIRDICLLPRVRLWLQLLLSNVRVVLNHMDVSSFQFLEITFSFHLQNIRMAILYRPGHHGTDRAFMEEFGQFLEILSVCWEKLVICGDFNYWLDNPSLKPYRPTNEFMSLLDINNMSNYVQVPTHISGHILDLVLTPVGVDLVNRVEVSPIDHRISDHALITFELDVIGPATYSKKITF